jgi:glycosidase
VLCAGWISLVVALFYNFKDNTALFITIFGGILVFICWISSVINRYLFLEWDHNNKKEQRKFDERTNRLDDEYGQDGVQYSSILLCPPSLPSPPCPPDEDNPFNQSRHSHSTLRIYHILVDKFRRWKSIHVKQKDDFHGGSLRGIIEKLGFIQSLGYNAIMLSPIFETKAYHGYHIVSYENIEPRFGTWQDFKNLNDAVHTRGMKLICDFVPNNCSYYNNLFQQALSDSNSPYRAWFYFNEGRKGGYVSYQNYEDLPKFNLYNADAANYMFGVAAKLVKEGVDGLRIDHAIGVPFEFLCSLKRKLKALNPGVIIIGEAWAINPRDVSQIEFISHCRKEELMKGCASDLQLQDDIQCDYIDYLDGVFDFTYMNIIIDEVKHGRRINKDNCKLMCRLREHFSRYPSNFRLILFLDNHDTNRFMFYCHNDKSIFDEAINFTKNLPYDSSYYYATELYAVNEDDVFSGKPNADMQVRKAYPWDDDKDSE